MKHDLKVEFKDNLSGFHPNATKIDLRNEDTQDHPFSVSAMVKDIDNDKFLHIRMRSEFPGSFFRESTMVGNNLVIANENQVYFIDIETNITKQFRLNGYFNHFRYENNMLFVLTNTHISCFSSEINQLWISDKLGVEKVDIKKFDGDLILGCGKWGDDKGIVDFRVSIDNGLNIDIATKTKKKKFFSSIFA